MRYLKRGHEDKTGESMYLPKSSSKGDIHKNHNSIGDIKLHKQKTREGEKEKREDTTIRENKEEEGDKKKEQIETKTKSEIVGEKD